MQTDVERISIYSASVFVLVSGNVGGDWRVRGLEHRVVIEAGEELKTWVVIMLGPRMLWGPDEAHETASILMLPACEAEET